MDKSITLGGCVILDDQGRVLLVHRNTVHRVQWETPGGKIEPGENPMEGARREVEEEIGVAIKIVRELGRREFNAGQQMMNYIWYLGCILFGQITLLATHKHDGWHYFEWEELQSMRPLLSPNARNLVDAYFEGKITL